MEYAWYYDLVLLYVVYSFLGWVAETVAAAARGRGFVKRGFAAGPFCYVYGLAAVIMAVGFDDLRDNLGYLFAAPPHLVGLFAPPLQHRRLCLPALLAAVGRAGQCFGAVGQRPADKAVPYDAGLAV